VWKLKKASSRERALGDLAQPAHTQWQPVVVEVIAGVARSPSGALRPSKKPNKDKG